MDTRLLMLIGTGCAIALTAGLAMPQDNSDCSDLQTVVRLALSPDRFASITGKPREGSFHETTVSLRQWRDCTIYGERTYACNSHDIATAEIAQQRLAHVAREVKECFGTGWWNEDQVRSSPHYVVLRHPVGPATMTISTDEDRRDVHVLRLTIFLRN